MSPAPTISKVMTLKGVLIIPPAFSILTLTIFVVSNLIFHICMEHNLSTYQPYLLLLIKTHVPQAIRNSCYSVPFYFSGLNFEVFSTLWLKFNSHSLNFPVLHISDLILLCKSFLATQLPKLKFPSQDILMFTIFGCHLSVLTNLMNISSALLSLETQSSWCNTLLVFQTVLEIVQYSRPFPSL